MAITTLDGLIAAPTQSALYYKTAAITTVAGTWYSTFAAAGNPGAGTLAVGNTANGLVHTDATAGYPAINAFAGGALGYIKRAAAHSTLAGTIRFFDRVFVAGAYAFNANTALASQPSFATRVSYNGGSADYTGLELWVEQVTAATGNQAVTVTYTNSAGTGSRSTGAVGVGAAPAVGRCWQLPLQAGDQGIQLITNVQGTVATAGTFNVMILRPLFDVYIGNANETKILNFTDLGMPEIFADSAIYRLLMIPSGTSSGTQAVGQIDICNG